MWLLQVEGTFAGEVFEGDHKEKGGMDMDSETYEEHEKVDAVEKEASGVR